MKMDENEIKKLEKQFYNDQKKLNLFFTKHFLKRVAQRLGFTVNALTKEELEAEIKKKTEEYFLKNPIENGYSKDFKSIRMDILGTFIRVFFHIDLNMKREWDVVLTTVTTKDEKANRRVRKNIKSKKKWLKNSSDS